MKRRSRGPAPDRQTLNLDTLMAEREHWLSQPKSAERRRKLERLRTTIRGVTEFRSVDLNV